MAVPAKVKKQLLAERRAWADSMPQQCMVSGWTPKGQWILEIHEICRKSQAPNFKWAHTCNYLLLSGAVHASPLIAISGRGSHIIQLAIKKHRDPDHFDLETWLAIRNPRAPEYITLEEIEQVDLSLYLS